MLEPIDLSTVSPPSEATNSIPEPADIIDVAGILKTPLHEIYGIPWGVAERSDKALNEIWGWARENFPEAETDEDKLWELKRLTDRLGTPKLGNKPWLHLQMYVSTDKQLRSLQRRKMEMEYPHV